MKHLLTAIACFLALSMSAQTPYNPDFDNDSLITFNDMLSFLPLYGSEFFPESSISTDSILIYDMQPEIDAHWESWQCCDLVYPTITIPATADKVVMLSTNYDNCTQGPSYCARVNLEVEDSYLYDEVTVIWVTTNHYPYNYWTDSYTYDNGGAHFKLINTGGGTWLGPWRQ